MSVCFQSKWTAGRQLALLDTRSTQVAAVTAVHIISSSEAHGWPGMRTCRPSSKAHAVLGPPQTPHDKHKETQTHKHSYTHAGYQLPFVPTARQLQQYSVKPRYSISSQCFSETVRRPSQPGDNTHHGVYTHHRSGILCVLLVERLGSETVHASNASGMHAGQAESVEWRLATSL